MFYSAQVFLILQNRYILHKAFSLPVVYWELNKACTIFTKKKKAKKCSCRIKTIMITVRYQISFIHICSIWNMTCGSSVDLIFEHLNSYFLWHQGYTKDGTECELWHSSYITEQYCLPDYWYFKSLLVLGIGWEVLNMQGVPPHSADAAVRKLVPSRSLTDRMTQKENGSWRTDPHKFLQKTRWTPECCSQTECPTKFSGATKIMRLQ